MSEQHRTRLYAWLRDQTDEPLAEYLMACLAPAPLSDLVTKDHLAAVVSRLATKDEMNAGFAALRNEHATQRAEDAAQRAEDRTAARHRHYWLTGTVVSGVLSIGVPIWLNTFGIIG